MSQINTAIKNDYVTHNTPVKIDFGASMSMRSRESKVEEFKNELAGAFDPHSVVASAKGVAPNGIAVQNQLALRQLGLSPNVFKQRFKLKTMTQMVLESNY